MRGTAAEIELNELFRQVHWHAWRVDAPQLELELDDVVALMPMLIESGSVGLVWPRVRHLAANYGAVGLVLEAAYQSQVEHNAKVEREIVRVVGRLQMHDIDPVLIKGWAVSRLYPKGIVRPAGDIDFVVRDADYDRARLLLAGERLSFHGDRMATATARTAPSPGTVGLALDLHRFSLWADARGDDFFAETISVDIGTASVRVPVSDAHLRVLVSHFLRHSAARLLRLCDIAMLVEARDADFNWRRCLSSDPIASNWNLTALGLAEHLLGVDLSGTPAANAMHQVPQWVVKLAKHHAGERQSDEMIGFSYALRRPLIFPAMLRQRWFDPISATVSLPSRFTDSPRWFVQARVFLNILVDYAKRNSLFIKNQ